MGRKKDTHGERLVIFCRYPEPGRAKTRLIPALGPLGAADLHRRLTEEAVAAGRIVAAERGQDLAVAFTGGSGRAVTRWLGQGLRLYRQEGGGLGERMESAFRTAFEEGARRVVLVGTDIPDLTEDVLHRAFDALSSANAVLGPSFDGGYWLIGLDRPASVFTGVPWGTAEVLTRTRRLVSEQGLRLHELEPLMDVDTPEDLRRVRSDPVEEGPFLSVIIPAFEEEACVASAVRSARSNEAEILVVDGGSTDGTVHLASRAGARVLSARRGRAAQQNQGRIAAKGRVLLFLHADSRLPEGYDRKVFQTLLDAKTAAGAFRFRTDGTGPAMRLVEALTNLRSVAFQLPYGDQGLFLRSGVFDEVGGFPDVMLAEDLLLVRRLSRVGRIRTASAAVTTSARRWRRQGVLRTTLVNQAILVACLLGRSPDRLAPLYRFRR